MCSEVVTPRQGRAESLAEAFPMPDRLVYLSFWLESVFFFLLWNVPVSRTVGAWVLFGFGQ